MNKKVYTQCSKKLKKLNRQTNENPSIAEKEETIVNENFIWW